MTIKSEEELEKYTASRQAIDYRDENIQKSTVLFQDMGSSITLYNWIHRFDSVEKLEILDTYDMTEEFLEEFKRLMREV